MLTTSDMAGRSLLLFFLVGSFLLAAPEAHADTGTFGVVVGGTQLEEAGDTSWHPTVRAEIAFRAVGPLALGAFVEGVAGEVPFNAPAFGAGGLAQVRARAPVLGVVPHLEASFARLQLPHDRQGRVDAWGASVGGGLGVEVDDGAVLEARLRRTWYYGIDESSGMGEASWSASLGVVFTL